MNTLTNAKVQIHHGRALIVIAVAARVHADEHRHCTLRNWHIACGQQGTTSEKLHELGQYTAGLVALYSQNK